MKMIFGGRSETRDRSLNRQRQTAGFSTALLTMRL